MFSSERQLKAHSSLPQRKKLKEDLQRGSRSLERSLSLNIPKTDPVQADVKLDARKIKQMDLGLPYNLKSRNQKSETGNIMSTKKRHEILKNCDLEDEQRKQDEFDTILDLENEDNSLKLLKEVKKSSDESSEDNNDAEETGSSHDRSLAFEETKKEGFSPSVSISEEAKNEAEEVSGIPPPPSIPMPPPIPEWLIPPANKPEQLIVRYVPVPISEILPFINVDEDEWPFEVVIDDNASYWSDHRISCDVCYDANIPDKMLRCKTCENYHCKLCVKGHVRAKITDGFMHIGCPSCTRILNDKEVEEHCSELAHIYMKNKVDAENNPRRKTCPGCNKIHDFPNEIPDKDTCSHCSLQWCVKCHAPWHVGMSCAKYQKDIVGKGKKALKVWAKCKGKKDANARKCPKCHFYIERISGCDHMNCSRCGTDFCYQCGKKHRKALLLGDHYSRYRFFGCKKNLAPDKPALRIAVRSGFLFGTVVALPVVGSLLISAGCILLAVSPVLVPAVIIKKKCLK